MTDKQYSIGVIGGGGWGLALAKLLAGNGSPVTVWEYSPEYLSLLRETHSNPVLLPGIKLPEAVSFTGAFSELISLEPSYIILAVPSQFLRRTLQTIPSELWSVSSLKGIVLVSKGIELGTNKLMHGVLREELPESLHQKLFVLSGPSHAEEVARKVPTTVVLAGTDETELTTLQTIFSNDYFRVYTSHDVLGVEIGGAVKNVIAIAAGMIRGMGFGDNSIGALLSRGIVEIQRLGIKLGAEADTFLGLSGIGDLITTATSEHSRNRHVGFQLGKGHKLAEILAEMSMVAEGVATTRSVHDLAMQVGVEMPIVEQVYMILYEDKDPHLAIRDLMLRELKAEKVR